METDWNKNIIVACRRRAVKVFGTFFHTRKEVCFMKCFRLYKAEIGNWFFTVSNKHSWCSLEARKNHFNKSVLWRWQLRVVLISHHNHCFRVKFSPARTTYGVAVSFWVFAALPVIKTFIDFSPFLCCADLAEIEIEAINREIKQQKGVNVNSNVVASSKRKLFVRNAKVLWKSMSFVEGKLLKFKLI